jgi:hypothetical protein
MPGSRETCLELHGGPRKGWRGSSLDGQASGLPILEIEASAEHKIGPDQAVGKLVFWVVGQEDNRVLHGLHEANRAGRLSR